MIFILCVLEWIRDTRGISDDTDIDTSSLHSHEFPPFIDIYSYEMYEKNTSEEGCETDESFTEFARLYDHRSVLDGERLERDFT
jgi:hypothetical protein